MSKYLLSTFLIVSFILYTWQQKESGPEGISGAVIEQSIAGLGSLPTPTPIALATGPTPKKTPVPTTKAGPTVKTIPVAGTNPTAASVVLAVVPTAAPAAAPTGGFRDGSYTGSVADAYYGNIQVKVVISGGRITDVIFLDYPRDRKNSQEINSRAMPILKSEAIQAQSANVNIVSGATETSQAFKISLQAALAQAS